MSAYLGNKGNDFTVLKNAHLGRHVRAERRPAGAGRADQGVHGHPAQVRSGHQAVLDGAQAGDPDQFVASILACQQMALLTAILQKAGPTLNYGTFAAAGNSLGKIVLPGCPDPWDLRRPAQRRWQPEGLPIQVRPGHLHLRHRRSQRLEPEHDHDHRLIARHGTRVEPCARRGYRASRGTTVTRARVVVYERVRSLFRSDAQGRTVGR